jgi:hypothetical protein
MYIRRDSVETVMRNVRVVVLMVGVLSGVVVMTIRHELAPIFHEEFVLPPHYDGGDEEARNSSPVQKQVIERPAFIDTTPIGWDVGVPSEFTVTPPSTRYSRFMVALARVRDYVSRRAVYTNCRDV